MDFFFILEFARGNQSQQPHLNALQRQFEQVKQHASPEGTKALMSKLDAVKTAYADVAENAAERQAVLLNAVKHRQQFYGQIQDFEKWLKKSQRKLDSGNEIYADEVPEMQLKLKARGEENLSLFICFYRNKIHRNVSKFTNYNNYMI